MFFSIKNTKFIQIVYKSGYIRCSNCIHNVVNKEKYKILFFGTDHFSLPSLQILAKECKSNGSVKELGVVTSFKSHINPVKMFADEEKLKLYNYPTPEMKWDYDLGVVVSFGYLIPKIIIDSFPLGMINVHASLLPRWRGAAPIIYSILNGETKTGVTIMKIHPHHFDVGEILLQEKVEIKKHEKLPEVHSNLATVGAALLLKCIHNLNFYLENGTKQNNSLATYAPKVERSLYTVSWNKMTSTEIYNLYRSLYNYKQLTTEWHKRVIKLIRIEEDELRTNKLILKPGYIKYSRKDKCIFVGCANDSVIKVYEILVEGKKNMSAIDFNNGFVKKKNENEKYFE